MASEVLSGSQTEVDEEDRLRSRVGAWEEAPSYLEAQVDPWDGMVPCVACP